MWEIVQAPDRGQEGKVPIIAKNFFCTDNTASFWYESVLDIKTTFGGAVRIGNFKPHELYQWVVSRKKLPFLAESFERDGGVISYDSVVLHVSKYPVIAMNVLKSAAFFTGNQHANHYKLQRLLLHNSPQFSSSPPRGMITRVFHPAHEGLKDMAIHIVESIDNPNMYAHPWHNAIKMSASHMHTEMQIFLYKGHTPIAPAPPLFYEVTFEHLERPIILHHLAVQPVSSEEL